MLALAVIPVLTRGLLSATAARRLRCWGVPTALYVAVLSAASGYYRIVGSPASSKVPRRTAVSVAMGIDLPTTVIALLAALLWIGDDRIRFPRRALVQPGAGPAGTPNDEGAVVEPELTPETED